MMMVCPGVSRLGPRAAQVTGGEMAQGGAVVVVMVEIEATRPPPSYHRDVRR